MRVLTWLGGPRRPSSSPEPSPSAGRRFAASGNSQPSSRLYARLPAALLILPLLAGLAPEAAAQSPNADGSYTVPGDWALKPPGAQPGDKFRLLFMTSTRRDATPTSIATYDSFVQARAAAGHTAIQPYSSLFKVVGSTATVDARDHTGTTGTGHPIYWLNGPRVAANYAGFWSDNWENWVRTDRRTESGTTGDNDWHWTGTDTDGTKHANPLGNTGTNVRRGQFSTGGSSRNPISHWNTDKTENHSFYALSPVFTVDRPSTTFTPASLTIPEGGYKIFYVKLDSRPASNITVGITSDNGDVAAHKRSLTFTPARWNKYQAVLVSASEDGDAADDTATLTIGGADSSLRVQVQDNDKGDGPTITVERISTHSPHVADTVREGAVLGFRVQADRLPAANMQVTLRVDQPTGARFVGRDEVSFTMLAGGVHGANRTQEIWLSTQDDGTDEPSGRVTLTVNPSSHYQVGSNSSASWRVLDDDLGPDEPCFFCVWVGDHSGHLIEGGTGTFFVNANPVPRQPLTLDVRVQDAPGRSDFLRGNVQFYTVTIPAGSTLTFFQVQTRNDSTDEPNSYISASVDHINQPSEGAYRLYTYYHRKDGEGRIHEERIQVEDDDGRAGNAIVTPTVTLSADVSSVTEGGDVTYTISADPAPTSGGLEVYLNVDQEMGDENTLTAEGYFFSGGSHTVTIPQGSGSVDWTFTAHSDSVELDDGEIVATIIANPNDASFYDIGTPKEVRIPLLDDDGVEPNSEDQGTGTALPTTHPVMKYASLVKSFYDRITARHQHGDSASGGWNKRFLKAMGHPEYVNYPQAAVTVADATRLWNHGGPGANTAWDGTVEAVTYAEQYFAGQVTPPDPPTPDPVPVPAVTIAAGADVTEGGSASFVLTATPAPSAALDVTVAIAATGDYGITAGTRTVTIPTTGSYTLTLATTGDDVDEPNGSVTATVNAGTGYTVGTASTGTVTIADDDLPPPANTAPTVANAIPDGSATAGTAFSFQIPADTFTDADGDSLTHSAARTDGSALPSWLAFDAGARTFSGTPAAGDAGTLTVRVTADDGRGGSVFDDFDVTVSAPTPAVSIAAGSGVTEGGSASFVLTATPAPAAPLDVAVAIAASGDYGIADATQTVTMPTTGSFTLTLATDNDGADEADGSVTATVDAGTGYTVGTPSTGTVAIADDDVPAIAIAAGADVTEGGDATFTLSADPVPHAPLAVTVALTAEGAYGVTAGERTVTMPVSGTATLTVATTGDDADEPDGSVTATVNAGTGYAVGSASTASVAVRDDDEPVIAAGPSVLTLVARDLNGDAPGHVTEGGTAEVEVRLNPAPAKHVSLYYRTLAGTAWTHHDFRLIRPTRMQFRPGETVKTIRVRTVNDAHDEGLEEFSVRVWPASADVTPKGGVIVTVTITNDDPMPAAYLARFGRTVAEQALDGIAGRMAASRTPGMQGSIAGQVLNFDPSASGQPAAGEPTMIGATPGVAGVSGTTPGIPSVNRDAALAMADVARGFGASAPAGSGGMAGSFGDRFGDAGFGMPSPRSRGMTAGEALLGSSFSLTGQDGAGGSLAFWGRASQGSFDGAERGDGTDITLDGAVTTGMLGADYARGNWLVGLALTQSTADGGYAAEGDHVAGSELGCPPDGQGQPQVLCDGAVRAGDGDVEASLTAAIPWAALQASERLRLWGAAGYGAGEVTLKTAMGGTYSADTSWSMAAAGVRGDLLEAPKEGSGPALALTSDALWTRTSSDGTADLAASDSDATRLRLGLEGSWRMALEGGGSLTPKLEVGARHDGGDAETGSGVEVGGGVAWVDSGRGLSLDVSGRTLLAHENDDLEDRGFAAALSWDPRPATRRGLSLSLRQEFGGQAQGGLDALFAPAPLEDRTGSAAASRWAMEAAYGLPAFGGRFVGSPHAGLGLSTGARDWSVGWRLTPEAATAPDLSFGLRATRRESDAADPEHTIGAEAILRW